MGSLRMTCAQWQLQSHIAQSTFCCTTSCARPLARHWSCARIGSELIPVPAVKPSACDFNCQLSSPEAAWAACQCLDLRCVVNTEAHLKSLEIIPGPSPCAVLSRTTWTTWTTWTSCPKTIAKRTQGRWLHVVHAQAAEKPLTTCDRLRRHGDLEADLEADSW